MSSVDEILIRLGITGLTEDLEKLGALKLALAAAAKETNRLTKEYKDLANAAGQRTQAEKDALASLGKQITESKEAAKGIRDILNAEKELAKTRAALANQKGNTAAKDSLVGMQQELANLIKMYSLMTKAERDSAAGMALEKSLLDQSKAVSALEQKMGNFRRNVGNYASAWNGLGNSISQVAREMPNFAQSATIGFMALSNNLPILFEEINKVKESIKASTQATLDNAKAAFDSAVQERLLAGATQAEANAAGLAAETQVLHNAALTAQPSLWKQILKALFSWHTLLIGVIALSVAYADEIGEMFTGVHKLTEAEKKLIQEQDDLNIQIHSTTNLWKLYKGEISATEAALDDVAYANRLTVDKIERDTKEKLEATKKWYYITWAYIKSGFKDVLGLENTGVGLDEERHQIQLDAAKVRLANKTKQTNDFHDAAGKALLKYQNEIRQLEINGIADEYKREMAAIKNRIKLAMEEENYTKASDIDKAEIRTKLYEKAALEQGLALDKRNKDLNEKIKKDIEDKLKLEEAYQKELLSLIEDYHKQGIDMIKDEHIKKYATELENHHNLLDEYKTHLGKTKEIDEQTNKLIEREYIRHINRMAEIKKEGESSNSDGRIRKLGSVESTLDDYDEAKKKSNKNVEETENKNKKNRDLAIDASIKAAKQTVDAIAKIEQDALDRRLKRELTAIQRNSDAQDRILENRLKNGIISEGQYNDAKQRLNDETAANEMEANRRAFEQKKELDTTMAIINGALAVTSILAQYPKFDGGIAMSIALAAAAITTATQVAVIQAQQFALGGKVDGKSHAEGGVNIEVEGGEGVINKRSMRSQQVMQAVGTPSQIASAINSTGGGINWESGASLRPNPQMFRNNTSSESITYAQMAGLIQDLKSGINDKKVVILESDMTKTQTKVKAYETSGRF